MTTVMEVLPRQFWENALSPGEKKGNFSCAVTCVSVIELMEGLGGLPLALLLTSPEALLYPQVS